MQSEQRDTRVLVWTEESNHGGGDKYLILHASFVYLDAETHELRHEGSYDARGSITVRGQIDAGRGRMSGYDADFYSTDVELREFTGALFSAERAVKELRRIVRHMERHAERFGAPADTTEHLARMAAAAGCKASGPFVRWTNSGRRHWSDTDYTTMSANDLRYHLRQAVRTWVDTNNLVPKDVAS